MKCPKPPFGGFDPIPPFAGVFQKKKTPLAGAATIPSVVGRDHLDASRHKSHLEHIEIGGRSNFASQNTSEGREGVLLWLPLGRQGFGMVVKHEKFEVHKATLEICLIKRRSASRPLKVALKGHPAGVAKPPPWKRNDSFGGLNTRLMNFGTLRLKWGGTPLIGAKGRFASRPPPNDRGGANEQVPKAPVGILLRGDPIPRSRPDNRCIRPPPQGGLTHHGSPPWHPPRFERGEAPQGGFATDLLENLNVGKVSGQPYRGGSFPPKGGGKDNMLKPFPLGGVDILLALQLIIGRVEPNPSPVFD
ncbi:hypothetical protein RRG08_003309 [Elysia crispata]|uniref:Uncharacterized protein n=1 Tax=Elysia crispata TaxID=231223 RepID=A0AAE0ZTQ3_9GAST|nr:hypothetical protein RRG08_003309 [Elysia crispata]